MKKYIIYISIFLFIIFFNTIPAFSEKMNFYSGCYDYKYNNCDWVGGIISSNYGIYDSASNKLTIGKKTFNCTLFKITYCSDGLICSTPGYDKDGNLVGIQLVKYYSGNKFLYIIYENVKYCYKIIIY